MKREIEANSKEKSIVIENQSLRLKAILGLPEGASGIIVFAHGSGSGRLSPRNNYVAHVLQQAQFGTLLLDLLTEAEETDRNNVFDIDLLSERLLIAKRWLAREPSTKNLKIGYFGASTGAGAALVAAAKDPQNVEAIVSRGGRPDLAGRYLPLVKAPTLLLVGGYDDVVIDLNRAALGDLRSEKELQIIPAATHLFEEPGRLEKVADLATDWFQNHFHGTETRREEAPARSDSFHRPL